MKTIIITIEGRDIPVAATPMSRLADITNDAKEFNTASAEGIQKLCVALWWGIERATPGTDVTADWIEMNLDVHNMAYVFNKFIEVNGLEKVKPSEGEAQAGQS